MNRFLSIAMVTLLSLSTLGFASTRLDCGADDNAREASDLVLRNYDESDPEVAQALDHLDVLQSTCHPDRLAVAEEGLEAFGFTLLEDDRQLESGCGTVAVNDLHDCQDACKLNTEKRFCGCAAAFVIDVIACVH